MTVNPSSSRRRPPRQLRRSAQHGNYRRDRCAAFGAGFDERLQSRQGLEQHRQFGSEILPARIAPLRDEPKIVPHAIEIEINIDTE